MNQRQKENKNRKIMQMIYGASFFSLPWTFKMRLKAYGNAFNLPKSTKIMEHVEFQRQHGLEGNLEVGRNVLFSRAVWIDYTGGLKIDDDVAISARAMVITHCHDTLDLKSKKINLTPLHIAEGAWICVNAMIMPGVGYIGKNSVISPGSVVYKKVPDYAIVRGNPAKVVAIVPPEVREAMKANENNTQK